jgi:nucleoside 2-deoxyribosyltransferase
MKRVFVIMPFSSEMLDVFILGIRWAAAALGVVAHRADDLQHAGDIVAEVKRAIREYDIVIGDTTGANPNVCYEVGIAHALDRPTLLICRDGEDLPFDLQGINHLKYPNVVELRSKLRSRLDDLLRGL